MGDGQQDTNQRIEKLQKRLERLQDAGIETTRLKARLTVARGWLVDGSQKSAESVCSDIDQAAQKLTQQVADLGTDRVARSQPPAAPATAAAADATAPSAPSPAIET